MPNLQRDYVKTKYGWIRKKGRDVDSDAGCEAGDYQRKSMTTAEIVAEEAINTSFCPSQEKFHTFVLRGLRNISEAP